MAFGISTRDTLAIRSFAQAEQMFNTTKEIRGTNKYAVGVPLQHSRRDWRHKALVKINDDTYAARLYDTNVVRWHRNGEVEIDFSYGSQSTDTFANYFLNRSGYNLGLSSNSGVVSMHSQHLAKHLFDRVAADHGGVDKVPVWCNFITEGRSLTVWTDADNKINLFPLMDAHKAYVDKSAASKLRKRFAPMLDYLKIFEAYPIQDVEPILHEYADRHELNRIYSVTGHVTRLVAERPEDESLWPVLAAAHHFNSYNWRSGKPEQVFRFQGVDALKKTLYPLLYRREGIYHYEQLPFGTLKEGWLREDGRND